MEMEWTRGITIGHGSSATVYLATSRRSSSDVAAVKSAELSSQSKSEQLQREQRILCSLSSHPHIVSYKGSNITKENNKLLFNLFMEYMPFGNLSQANLRHGGGRLEEPAVAHYTRQIVMGLEYLHANGVVHCDIKGSNILVSEDGVVKIGDFGCAKRVSVNENDRAAAAAIGGTPMFMAPEVARGEEQGYPCDVWALGCTVVEMATGFAPWPNVDDPVSVLYRVAYSGESPEIPCFLSEQAKDFLGKCFRRDPKERWSCSQLLKHPFLAEFDSNNNNNAKGLLNNNNNSSSSPTSILEQGFWSSVVEEESESESECFTFDNLGIENSPAAGRVKRLALCSGDPNWTWGDENWITTRGDDAGAASSSTSDWYDLDKLERSDVSGRISGYNICEDYDCNRDVSVVVNSLNFERGIAFAQMLLPSTLDFL